MMLASLLVALVGAFIVAVATIQQLRLDPDDPKYRVGLGTAVTPPQPPLGVGAYLGAPQGALTLHVSAPGTRQLVVDQGRLTRWVALGAVVQVVAVCLALAA